MTEYSVIITWFMITPPSFPTENMSQSVHRSCLNFSCVKHGSNQNFKFRSSCSLRVAVPSSDGETEARECLHKHLSCSVTSLWFKQIVMFYVLLRSDKCQREGYRDTTTERKEQH